MAVRKRCTKIKTEHSRKSEVGNYQIISGDPSTPMPNKKSYPKILFLLQFSYFTLLLRSCHSIFGGIANKREETFWTHIFCPLQKKIHQKFGGEMVGFILRVSNVVDRILSFRVFVTVTFQYYFAKVASNVKRN